MKRILLTISYDGTNFCGWQRQKNEYLRTVQGEVDWACGKLFIKDINCIGASRTDAGVHAVGQRAVIDVETTIPTERLPMAINSHMPEDIVVTAAEEVEADFNPRFRALRKTYEYKIYNSPFRNPMYRNYSEYVKTKLDVEKMAEAAKAFLGKHDFKAFCASGNSSKTTVREIYDISVAEEGDFIVLRVTGNGFLYNMVRIIAGTLIYVGIGKIKPDEIEDIINSKDRSRAGKTAGPRGLTLMNIVY